MLTEVFQTEENRCMWTHSKDGIGNYESKKLFNKWWKDIRKKTVHTKSWDLVIPDSLIIRKKCTHRGNYWWKESQSLATFSNLFGLAITVLLIYKDFHEAKTFWDIMWTTFFILLDYWVDLNWEWAKHRLKQLSSVKQIT